MGEKVLETINKITYSVVIVEPKIAGNIGAVARLCNNFSVKDLILVNPQTDYLSDDSLARAMHSKEYLTELEIVQSLAEIREKYQLLIGTSAKAGKSYNIKRQPIYPWNLCEIKKANGDIALVFGREDNGLTNDELKICDFLVKIPAPGKHPVLNLSHAVAILLYEVWKIIAESEQENTHKTISSSKQREVLFSTFEDYLSDAYYPEHKKPIVNKVFQNVINRSMASSDEIESLLGIFREIKNLSNKTKVIGKENV